MKDFKLNNLDFLVIVSFVYCCIIAISSFINTGWALFFAQYIPGVSIFVTIGLIVIFVTGIIRYIHKYKEKK